MLFQVCNGESWYTLLTCCYLMEEDNAEQSSRTAKMKFVFDAVKGLMYPTDLISCTTTHLSLGHAADMAPRGQTWLMAWPQLHALSPWGDSWLDNRCCSISDNRTLLITTCDTHLEKPSFRRITLLVGHLCCWYGAYCSPQETPRG